MSEQDAYQSFEKVFREHYAALANYALSILRSRDDAEDVVQEVFVRTWENQAAVIGTPQVKFYLFTAVRNGCISHLRKMANKTIVDPESVSLGNLADREEPTPVGDLRQLVDEAMTRLPEQCGIVFRLSRFGKLSYREIAEELEISVKTVENHMGKALRILRDFARQKGIRCLVFLFWLWQGGS